MTVQTRSHSGVLDAAVEAAIGHDLHVSLCEQHVDEDSVALARVPDAELREHLERAFARSIDAP